MTQRKQILSWEQRVQRAREFGLNWGVALYQRGVLPIDGPLPGNDEDVRLLSRIKWQEHHAFHTAILHGYVRAAAADGLTTDGIPRRNRDFGRDNGFFTLQQKGGY